MFEAERKKRKYGTVSIPMGIIEQVDFLIKEIRYWPSRGAFVREACLEKIRLERNRLRERGTNWSASEDNQ
jgi:metal-responsive CopG/Arc/MetJ family transcriptional regulator